MDVIINEKTNIFTRHTKTRPGNYCIIQLELRTGPVLHGSIMSTSYQVLDLLDIQDTKHPIFLQNTIAYDKCLPDILETSNDARRTTNCSSWTSSTAPPRSFRSFRFPVADSVFCLFLCFFQFCRTVILGVLAERTREHEIRTSLTRFKAAVRALRLGSIETILM